MNLLAFDHVGLIAILACTVIDNCYNNELFRVGRKWVHSNLLPKTCHIVTVKLASSEINTHSDQP
jgi:hypothetical protein